MNKVDSFILAIYTNIALFSDKTFKAVYVWYKI